jgi:hypothetical protein
MEESRKVTNLHGNTYEVVSWKFYPAFPSFKHVVTMSMDKDIISGKLVNFVKTTQNVYMVEYNQAYNLMVLFKLKFISYNEKLDLRKSYIRGNRYHS